MEGLDRIETSRRPGTEQFLDGRNPVGFDVLSFWQWAYSDLVSNATRGVVAEYLVARALGAANGVREEWAAYDVLDPRGITVQVKSAAYVQSWRQDRLSSIIFGCGKTQAWDAATNELGIDRRRHAHVYVFALLAEKDQSKLNPLDVAQWQFYVVPTAVLDARRRSQHSITLPSLRELHTGPVTYWELGAAVGAAMEHHLSVVGHQE